MSNIFAAITDKKYVGSGGVKKLWKSVLALLEATVDAVEEELDDKPNRFTATATVPTTGWTLTDGLYHVTVSVPGMLATDAGGGIGPVQTGTTATDKAMLKSWSKVTRSACGAGSITLYASAIPTVSIPIFIEVFR